MTYGIQTEDEYDDLLALWSDLESGLDMLLNHPARVAEFAQRIKQYDQWMQDLLRRDTDVGLYLLFQLANHSPVGYSASHALVSAVLCHLIAADFALPAHERDSLVHAALTMNLAMTALQNELARQLGRPTDAQQAVIQEHPQQGALLLGRLGISDTLWLQTVALHHAQANPAQALDSLPAAERLACLLNVVDRYAAMISPRQSREGRSATESAHSIIHGDSDAGNQVGPALVRIVGLCPPGTFVQLSDNTVAVVMRRSGQPNLPDVALVINPRGELIRPPTLYHTTLANPGIKAALAAAAVQERINHHLILQLGSRAESPQ